MPEQLKIDIAPGQTVQLHDASVGGGTYLWTLSDGRSSTEASPHFEGTDVGTVTVTLTKTNAGGSASRTKTGFLAVGQTPGTTPQKPTNIVVGTSPAGPYTAGAVLTLASTVGTGIGPYTYAWTITGATPITATTASVQVTAAAAGVVTYSLVVTDTSSGLASDPVMGSFIVGAAPTVQTVPVEIASGFGYSTIDSGSPDTQNLTDPVMRVHTKSWGSGRTVIWHSGLIAAITAALPAGATNINVQTAVLRMNQAGTVTDPAFDVSLRRLTAPASADSTWATIAASLGTEFATVHAEGSSATLVNTTDISSWLNSADVANGFALIDPDGTMPPENEVLYSPPTTGIAGNRPTLIMTVQYTGQASTGNNAPPPAPAPSPTPAPAPTPVGPGVTPQHLPDEIGQVTVPVPAAFKIGMGMDFQDWIPQGTVDLMQTHRGYALDGFAGDPTTYPATLDANGLPVGISESVIFSRNDTFAGSFNLTVVAPNPPTIGYNGGGWTLSTPTQDGTVGGIARWRAVVSRPAQSTPAQHTLGFHWPAGMTVQPTLVPVSYGIDGAHPFLRDECLNHFKTSYRLRFMDVNHVNFWDARTWATRPPEGGRGGKHKSWTFQFNVGIALCNAAGSKVKRLRYHLPTLADDDYITNLLQFANTALIPFLPAGVLVEWVMGNEIWNSGFMQFHWLLADANDVAGPYYSAVNVSTSYQTAPDQYDRFAHLWALRVARLGQLVNTHQSARGRVIFEGQQYGLHWQRTRGFPFLRRAENVTAFGAINSYVDGLSCGGYTGGSAQEYADATSYAAFVQGMSTTFENAVGSPSWSAQTSAWARLAAAHGVPEVDFYEWGIHTHESAAIAGTQNIQWKLDYHLSSHAHDVMLQIASTGRQLGVGSGTYFTGAPNPYSLSVNSFSWPISQVYDESGATSPKLQAFREIQTLSGE